jgi:hypothetical protein
VHFLAVLRWTRLMNKSPPAERRACCADVAGLRQRRLHHAAGLDEQLSKRL